MSKPTFDPDTEEPLVRFGGEWLPAHDVWEKMETATVVVDSIDRFNTDYPHLATPRTREVVPLVRQRLKDIELRLPYKGGQEDLAKLAVDLLGTLPPEDVLDLLEEKHGTRLGMIQLIQLAGEQSYRAALRREAEEFQLNRVSSEQTADLWNDLQRPAPGGGLWSAKKVELLLTDAG